MLFEDRAITPHYSHVLKAVDPDKKLATFATTTVDTTTKAKVKSDVEMPYDYLHVIPPQRAPDVIRQSGLSWADKWTDQGWGEVDMKTLRAPALSGGFCSG